ncbi:MAG: hypothetical protein JSS09_07630, partial [Verrucomicrobia bacterium]|nr:hypothetical protein [Verrucomicrobiota bacterium]
LVSTCNRTEIYFSSYSIAETHSDVISALKKVLGRGFEQRVYSYFKDLCFIHLAKVCAGIDSVIFGEAEIQRQVKVAYAEASLRYKLSASLHYLFQKSLKIGKAIRTEFELPKGTISLESTIWNLARCFFGKEKPISVLLIGYSKINRKIIHFFKNKEGVLLHLATRNPQTVEENANSCSFIPWTSLSSWTCFDMVISGSKCSDYLLYANQIPTSPHLIQSKLVVDLGVPRNIDPLVGKNPLITLFNIEDIGGLIDRRKVISLCEQKDVEMKLEQLVVSQMGLYQRRKERTNLCV